MRRITGQPGLGWPELRGLISRVIVHADRVEIGLTVETRARAVIDLPPEASDGTVTVVEPVVLKHRAGRSWFETGRPGADRPRIDRSLVAGLRRAHRELATAGIYPSSCAPTWRDCSGVKDRYLRTLIKPAFLAPDIRQAIMDGRQPIGLTLQAIRDSDIPLGWADQRERFGFNRA